MSDTLPKIAPARRLRAEWLLVALILAVYGYFFNSGSWNQNARLDAIFAFVEPGPDQWTFRIDGFLPQPERGLNTGDWNRVGSHYYANKMPGTILWGALGYLPFHTALRLLGLDPRLPAWTSASAYWINLWVSVLPLAAAAWAFSRLLERLGSSRARATLVTAGLFLCSALFPYATQLWGHTTAAACVCGALYLHWGNTHGGAPCAGSRRALWAGVLAGGAVCMDFLAAPFAVVCVVWAWRRSRRDAAQVILGGSAGLLCLLGYDWYCFGSPLHFPTDGTNPGFVDPGRFLGLFGSPSGEALWQLTFGAYRGIFVQMPVLVLALIGFGFWFRRDRRDPLLWGALAVVLGTLWLTASFNGWHGGATVCARYLIPCLPLLLLGLKELPVPLWSWPLGLAAGCWSFVNMLAIAAVNPLVQDRASNPLYRVIYAQFTEGALGGQRLPLRLQALSREQGISTTTNLGSLLGLEGHAQLLPLWALLLGTGALAVRELGGVGRCRATWSGATATERQKTLFSGLLVAVSLAYVLTLASTILGGDNAEFVTLAQRWGVAHPSGYPTYLLYLRLFSWLPGTTPAMTAALATAVLGVLSVLALYRACLAWQASPFAALVASALIAWSPRLWIASTHAEVFAMNALAAALILWLSAPGLTLAPERRLWLLGGLAGLSLANHLSIVLVAPIGLVAAFQALKASARRGRAAALALGCLGLGLLPYLSLLLLGRASSGWSWGELSTFSDLWAHVLRKDYGTLSFGINEQGGTPLQHVGQLLLQASADLLWLPLVLLPLGTLALARSSSRAQAVALLVTLLTTGPLFVARINLGTEGLARSVVQRFYLLPELVAIPILALGLTLLEQSVRQQLRPALLRATGLATLGALGAAQLFGTLPELTEHHAPTVERYLQNTLASAPPSSVILGTGDQRLFGFAALQELAGLRRDVQYIDPRMLHYPWYHRRAEQRFGAPLPQPQGGSMNTVELANRVLAAGKPLFITDTFSETLLKARRSYPFGTLIGLLPGGVEAPLPSDLEQKNLQLFASFDLNYPRPMDSSSWAWGVQSAYARPWRSLAGIYHRLGDESRAAINEERARSVSPGL